ncbi:hypothetical protein [Janthinobacterium sp. SUN033]|uniref:hypothetical protein n=1 Tax=Janthinobacterium sp. SUN033 TaxID=3002439 RepID=UPI0025AFAE81|nr:hypothetical protein [Janthinobacterium sp. SUN033]MDN2676709.1 hypothetical protein [Janthinobacterium sp. SUN033]
MSDIGDVQNSLVAMVAAAVYPSGTGAASVSGKDIVVYAGWPTSSRLDADLLVEKAHVTVFQTQTEANKTRYPKDWKEASINTAGLAIAVTGQQITISGAPLESFQPENVSVRIGRKSYVLAATPEDTPETLAGVLAVQIAADWPAAVAAGGVITLPAAANITAALIGVAGTVVRVLRTLERVFHITVWSATPAQRDVIGRALDTALAGIERFTLADGYGARLIYRSSHITDHQQKAKLYRRDFQYSVEYSMTQSMTATQITQTALNSTGSAT